MVNVSVTSSTEPDKVRLELLRVLTNQGINPVQDGYDPLTKIVYLLIHFLFTGGKFLVASKVQEDKQL